ncbi:MAG: hypothetical protein GY830_00620 [Bacteroidetes bacterium]|nr:hypothetical protein [Bacteroidota bacterium]
MLNNYENELVMDDIKALKWTLINNKIWMFNIIFENMKSIDTLYLKKIMLELSKSKDKKSTLEKVFKRYENKISQINSMDNIILNLLKNYDFKDADDFIKIFINNKAKLGNPNKILVKLLKMDKFDLFNLIYKNYKNYIGNFDDLFEKVLFSDKSDKFFNLLLEDQNKIKDKQGYYFLISVKIKKNIDRTVKIIDNIKIKFSKEFLSRVISNAFLKKLIKISNALLRYNKRQNSVLLI